MELEDSQDQLVNQDKDSEEWSSMEPYVEYILILTSSQSSLLIQ